MGSVHTKQRGVQGVLFHKDGKMKHPWKGPKQALLLPLSVCYGFYYTLNTGIPRKLAGKPFLQSAEPEDPFDYAGHGLTAANGWTIT
jgi:hypothetical protein